MRSILDLLSTTMKLRYHVRLDEQHLDHSSVSCNSNELINIIDSRALLHDWIIGALTRLTHNESFARAFLSTLLTPLLAALMLLLTFWYKAATSTSITDIILLIRLELSNGLALNRSYPMGAAAACALYLTPGFVFLTVDAR